MKAPQIILIVLWSMSLASNLALHGRASKIDFWKALLSMAVNSGLLIWGGFFG